MTPRTASRRARQRVVITAALLVGIVAVSVGARLTSSGNTVPFHARLQLGLAGPYSPVSLSVAKAAGVTSTLVELSWAEAEPANGRFDSQYLGAIAGQIRHLRNAGFGVALNTGLQDAPGWLLDMPGARFVDQFGAAYTAAPVPNLVFGTRLRAFAQAYLTHLFGVLGVGFSLVRAGGGYWGELGYPSVYAADGHIENLYWAYDAAAVAASPTPGWRPGDASRHGEAATFLNWYLNKLVAYQDWQVRALRAAGFHGWIAMLYPSSGMRPGDFHDAVADRLDGTSSTEVNGEPQRGFAFLRQVAAVRDRRVVVYSTWGENFSVVDFLARLARRRGLRVMAENAGPLSQSVMNATLSHAARDRLMAFYLIRATDLLEPDHGSATLGGIAEHYLSLPPA